MPASDKSRFERRLRTVIAGKGFLESECRLLIMQFDRFNARRLVSELRLSGISLNKLSDRSSECKVEARGIRLLGVMKVSPLSARLRCLRNRHLEACSWPRVIKLDELCRGVECTLELSLPDDLRNFGVPPLG